MKKLSLLKAALCTRNKDVFGDVNRRLADLLEDLQGVHHDILVNGFSKDLYCKETKIKAEIDSMLSPGAS